MTLRRVTIERQPDGTWRVVREREETGEAAIVLDLIGAFAFVRAAYWPDGEERERRTA